MDPAAAYSITNLAWLSMQAIPLIIWPSFISSVLRAEYQPSNDMETYFARALGLALLTLGLTVIVLSGILPLSTTTSPSPSDQPPPSPYAPAVILLSALHHALAAFHCHTRHQATGQTGFLLGTLGSAGVGVFGLWFVMFAGDRTRVSAKYGGLDKNMSGWPFWNKEAYRSKKKGL